MKNLVGILSLASIFFIVSCESEELETGLSNLTSEEASAVINDVAGQMDDDIIDMVESDGIKALEDFAAIFTDVADFENGRAAKRSWIRKKLELIARAFVTSPASRVTDDDDFVFDDVKGVWIWNPKLDKFEKSSEEDVFIAKFPTEGSSENNAELTITKLELVMITSSDEWGEYSYQELSEAEGSLMVDSEKVIELGVSISWSDEGYPTKGSAELDIAPFSFAAAYDDTQTTVSSASASISKNDEILMAVNGQIIFSSSEKASVTFVEGFVQYSNLKIDGTVDASFEWSDENGEVVDDVNDFVNLDMLIDDQKVGDIVFEEDIAYLVYTDGTKENLEELLEPIIENIEESIEEFEDDDFD